MLSRAVKIQIRRHRHQFSLYCSSQRSRICYY
jgi:hypothetical protein